MDLIGNPKDRCSHDMAHFVVKKEDTRALPDHPLLGS